MVKTDETGLHAEDCECPKCDVGLGSSPLERAAARRAFAARCLADAAKKAAAIAAIKRGIPAREPPRPTIGPSRPYSQEEQAELIRMRAAFKAGKKVSDADDVDE